MYIKQIKRIWENNKGSIIGIMVVLILVIFIVSSVIEIEIINTADYKYRICSARCYYANQYEIKDNCVKLDDKDFICGNYTVEELEYEQ